jgi:nucleoside-diphosphate-sugar epimerase
MTRVLITGAAGFIGSHLAEACLERGWEVVAVDSLTSYYDEACKRRNLATLRADPRCIIDERDIVELDVRALVRDVRYVFHLAAQPGVRASWGQNFHVYTHANITATQHLLEGLKDSSIEKFVFASSSSVYGDAERFPTPEGVILQPISPYGATKVLGEHLVHLYWRNYGIPGVIVRYFSVYGPRQRPDMAFHRLAHAALTQSPFPMYGDGEQRRDFTFVSDSVTGTLAAAEHGEGGRVYNIGTGRTASMIEVIRVVEELSGREVELDRHPSQRGDVRVTGADVSRARLELGFQPCGSLRDGLLAELEWLQGELVTVG